MTYIFVISGPQTPPAPQPQVWDFWSATPLDRIQLYLQNCLQQVSCIQSMFTHHFSVSGKSVFTQRTCPTLSSCQYYRMWYWDCYIWQVQWMQLVAVSSMITVTFVSSNYSMTYPLNILIVGSSYRIDFTLFYFIFILFYYFIEIWMLILCLNILFYHGPINCECHNLSD